jgi:hypothetical protein
MTNLKNTNYLILIAALSLSSMLFSKLSSQIFYFLLNKKTEYADLFYTIFFLIFIYSFLLGSISNLNFKKLYINNFLLFNLKSLNKNFYIFILIYFIVETISYILNKDENLLKVFIYLLILSFFFYCFSTLKVNLSRLSLFGKYFLNIFFTKCIILLLFNFNLQNFFVSFSSVVNVIIFCSYIFIFFCKEDKKKIIYYSIISLFLLYIFKSKLFIIFFLFFVYFNFIFKGNKINYIINFFYIILFFMFFVFFICYLIIINFDVVLILNYDWKIWFDGYKYECGLFFHYPEHQYLFRLYSLTCNNLIGKFYLFFLNIDQNINFNFFTDSLDKLVMSSLISIKERLIYIVEFLNIIKINKLLPSFYNIENYNNYFFSDFAKNYYDMKIKINSHNSFVYVVYKMGLVGFVFIFYLLYSVYLNIKKPELHINIKFLIVFFLCFMFLQDNMFKNSIIVSLFFWLVVGLTFNKKI